MREFDYALVKDPLYFRDGRDCGSFIMQKIIKTV